MQVSATLAFNLLDFIQELPKVLGRVSSERVTMRSQLQEVLDVVDVRVHSKNMHDGVCDLLMDVWGNILGEVYIKVSVDPDDMVRYKFEGQVIHPEQDSPTP